MDCSVKDETDWEMLDSATVIPELTDAVFPAYNEGDGRDGTCLESVTCA